MDQFVGLDVSQELTHLCVIGSDGGLRQKPRLNGCLVPCRDGATAIPRGQLQCASLKTQLRDRHGEPWPLMP